MEDDYNPFTERTGQAMTNNLETFIHLVKSSLGTGILAMPKAFSYVGLAEGGVLVYTMGAFCIYGLHILINSLHLVSKHLRVPVIQYGDGFRGAVSMGPSWVQPFQTPSTYIVEFFLFTYQLGICCVYVAFAAKNMAMVIAREDVSDAEYMAWVALVLLVLSQIRTLKVLTPVSLAANLSMVVGQAIIWYYIFRDLPPIQSRPMTGPLSGLPKFMGIVLFAMESLGVIITLENNMANPTAFTGLFGILNAGMAVVITLYAVLGFFGFYQYGEEVADVITLNLPGDWTGQSVKVIYALAIVLTYPLQMWPVLEITWGKYVVGYWLEREDRWYDLWESLYRAALVLLTYLVAIVLPNLDFIISLLGVFCLSMLGITFPALMEMCTHYEIGYGRLKWKLLKDFLIASIGIFVLVVGLWTVLRSSLCEQ